MLNISVFAVPLSGNKGSASMFFGLRDAFKSKDIEATFNIFSYYPVRDALIADKMDNVEVLPGHPVDIAFKIMPSLLVGKISNKLLPGNLKQIYQALIDTDVVLLVGGTTFSDSMLFKVPWNVLAALPGYLLKKPTFFLSQTMGPFNKFFNKLLAKWTFTRATGIHGRGRISAKYVANLGISNCKYMPDLSFNMLVPEFSSVAAGSELVQNLKLFMDNHRDKRIIGFAPNTIVYQKAKAVNKDYIGFIKNAIEYVQKEGHIPVLIPHSYREEASSLHNNDRGLCHHLMERLSNKTDIYYLDADLSPMELRSIIGQLHILVASRFHSMISALAMGVPPVTLGWGYQKYTEVLDEFGMSDYYVSFKELDENIFFGMISEAIDKQEALSKRIMQALPSVINHSEDVVDDIVLSMKEEL